MVKFKGESILVRDIPLDNVTVQLELKNGKLVLAPLDFGVAGGKIVSRLTLDASKDLIQTDLDATCLQSRGQGADAEAERESRQRRQAGRAREAVDHRKLGRANGRVRKRGSALLMSQGRVSTSPSCLPISISPMRIKYLLRGDPNAPVYCAVTSAAAARRRNGTEYFCGGLVGREHQRRRSDRLQE